MSVALSVIQNNPAIALLPEPQEWALIKEQASILVKSGFLPDAIKTEAQAIAIAIKGRELGVPMMHAFAHIVIIKGKPTMSAELMLGQIYRLCPEAKITYVEMTDKVCRIKASRPGSEPFTFVFSWEDAVRAQLVGKDNWSKWPRAMIKSRCISEMARSLFPDALMGVSHTPQELDENIPLNEGTVIDIKAGSTTPTPRLGDKPAVVPPEQAERISKCVAAFSEIGVTQKQIEDKLGHQIEKCDSLDFDGLGLWYSELKAAQEQKTASEPVQSKPGSVSLSDRVKG